MLPVASLLFGAIGFDFVAGTAIDWMQVVCLGIVRGLLDKWLNLSHELYFIGNKVKISLGCIVLSLK